MLNGIMNLGVSYYQSPHAYSAAARRTAGHTALRRTAVPAAQTGTPVEAVRPVRQTKAVSADTPLDHSDLLRRLETDPAAARVRGQIQYVGNAASQTGNASQTEERPWAPDTAENAVRLPGQKEEERPWAPDEAGDDVNRLPGQKEEPKFGDPRIVDASREKEEKEPYETKSAQETAEEGECQTCKRRKYQDGSDDPGVSFKTPTNIAPEQAQAAVRGHENEHVVRERAKAQREDRKVVSQSVTYHSAICPECGRVYTAGGTTRTVTAANSGKPEELPGINKEKLKLRLGLLGEDKEEKKGAKGAFAAQ